MFTQIFVGLIMVVVGYFLTWRANDFLANFGRIAFFERHLGTEGGSRLFYKLLGVLLILAGFLLATGLLQSMLRSMFSQKIGL